MEIGQREIELRGGRIVLYTRADDRHGIWQCRLRLGAERKLIRRSTKTTDLAEAKATAEELYEELRFKHRHNQPLKETAFKQVADDYVRKVARDVTEGRLSKGRLALIQGTLRRYLLPFFGKCLIGAIDQADFAEYDEWRLNYWTSGIGADLNVARKAKIPAQQTLAMEQSILRLLFRHAVEQGILEQLPYMTTKRAKTNRRVAFDLKEYRLLIQTARARTRAAKPRLPRRSSPWCP